MFTYVIWYYSNKKIVVNSFSKNSEKVFFLILFTIEKKSPLVV